jgi:aspartyl-tRNA(Asn)/glutamyl-tRNA(Gln) amidotransferase subunit C
MSITLDEVRHIAHLARLDLSPPELETMTRQLGDILAYVDQLKEVNVEGIEPLAHPLPVQNVFRADEPRPSLTADEALANAPNRKGDFFGVPAVLE